MNDLTNYTVECIKRNFLGCTFSIIICTRIHLAIASICESFPLFTFTMESNHADYVKSAQHFLLARGILDSTMTISLLLALS
ncbi:hypothetical protein BGW37DRAFT_57192 [Umbelopsis sp. PMI_123]|nr:hypothetical protein BGW37DRAFT_57192 [Umbelopsis sp. PMI_123]